MESEESDSLRTRTGPGWSIRQRIARKAPLGPTQDGVPRIDRLDGLIVPISPSYKNSVLRLYKQMV